MDGRQRIQQRRGVRINFNKESGRRHDRKEQGEKGVIMVIRKHPWRIWNRCFSCIRRRGSLCRIMEIPISGDSFILLVKSWSRIFGLGKAMSARREEVFLAPSILLWKQIWITEGFMRENGRERGPMGLCTG